MNGSSKDLLHVLFLPSFYSDPERPVVGSFFKEQARAVTAYGVKVGLAYCEPRSVKKLSINSFKENHFQISSLRADNLTTFRLHGFNPYLQSFLGGVVWSWLTVYLVWRYIALNGRPHLIHAHNALWGGYAASKIKYRFGIPYILTEHSGAFLTGELSSSQKKIAEDVYKNADEIIVVSTALQESISNAVKLGSSRVIPNCVDGNFFTLPSIARSNEKFSFLAIAHLSENKGIDVLIKSFALKFVNRNDTILMIGGDGAIKGALQKLADELSVGDKVIFLGALSRDSVRQAMWSSNALVVSSHHETFGVVLIEAIATGIPVISTRCGGPNSIVVDEVGVLVNPGSILELAEALEKLRDGPSYSSIALRKHILGRYGSDTFGKSLSMIYKNLLSDPKKF